VRSCAVRTIDPRAVADLVRRIADEELIPRFGVLESKEIWSKPMPGDPDDIATAADRIVEERLSSALLRMLPGSAVLGEEASHGDSSRARIWDHDGPVWVIDPLDGTRNFAAGNGDFGVMVALVFRETRAAWIYLPLARKMFWAERGAGAYRNGVRLDSQSAQRRSPLRGSIYTRFMPEEIRAALVTRAGKLKADMPLTGSAAIEYTSLCTGEKDFVVYHRLLPWDHAAGALLLIEAGGAAFYSDGKPYSPARETGPMLLIADARRSSDVGPLLFA
jgi:fructose-1,6-bisphosphatase/inositol monophosphatase family enzyme